MRQDNLNVDNLLILNSRTGWWAAMQVPPDMDRSASIHMLTDGFANYPRSGNVPEDSEIMQYILASPYGPGTAYTVVRSGSFWSFSDIGLVGTVGHIGSKFVSPLLAAKRKNIHMTMAILDCSTGNSARRTRDRLCRNGFVEYQKGRISVR
jgi:hypothetical protein